MGLGDHWDVGLRFTSLGVTTSPGTFGKFPNSEPQFPNQSNVALNQKTRQQLFYKPILSVPYSHSQNFELAIIVKNQKALHKNLDLKLLLLKKGKSQEPWAPIPQSPRLSSSHLLWSEPGRFSSLLQAPLFPIVLLGLFICSYHPPGPYEPRGL